MIAPADRPVIIVGAGIAGMTVALCLKKHNIPATIIEKRTEPSSAGAGIQITPNAFRILADLGLAETLIAKGHSPRHLSIFSGKTSNRITQMPLGKAFEEKHKAPYLVLHRQALVDALLAKIRENRIAIKFGTPFTPHFHNEGSLVLACDGVWSTMRPLVNAQAADFSGRIAFRCLIPQNLTIQSHDLSMWLGEDAHLVHYPVNKDGFCNLVVVVKGSKPQQRWAAKADQNDVVSHLKGWAQEPLDIIRKGAHWTSWPLYSVSPHSNWTKNNIALLGDAAHAMLPFLAQGGAMAIEDAAVLAHTLATKPDIKTAFATYQSQRQDRVTRIWQEAETNGKRYHWRGIKAATRNMALKSAGGKYLQDRYNWIYGWRAPSSGG